MTFDNAFTLVKQRPINLPEFIQFWADAYDYAPANGVYDQYVLGRGIDFAFDAEILRKLFTWKNNTGDKLTAKKEETVNKIVKNLHIVNELEANWDEDLFKEVFGVISTVWQVFLMHIIQPDLYPIFDQHVYRAYIYLKSGKSEDLKGTKGQQMKLYRDYQSFFTQIMQEYPDLNPRQIDKAFWAFGRFLKQNKRLVEK